MDSKKSFNKKILLPIPVIIFGVIIYFNFIKKQEFLYTGTIEATKFDISSRVASVISTFPAKEGYQVKQDELLVTLACEDIKLNNNLAEKKFERADKLFKTGTLSQEDYDQLMSTKNNTTLQLDWCSIKSIKDAKVLNTYREVGEYVTPGTKLLTLVNLSEVWTIIYVPQSLLVKISTGMDVIGYLPESDMKSFNGKISYISDNAEFTPKNVQTRQERTRLVFGVKIVFPNIDELTKPGMSLEIKLD